MPAEPNTLRTAVQNLRRELAVADMGMPGIVPDLSGPSTPSVPEVGLAETLRGVDAAYDTAALSAAPLTYTLEWYHIRNLADALRDLRDEIENGRADTADYALELREDTPVHGTLHALAAHACRTISLLAFETSRRQPRCGPRDSPAWRALRHLHQAADTAAAYLLGNSGNAACRETRQTVA